MKFDVKEMDALSKALEVAFTEMTDNVKRTQDTADQALGEVKRLGTIEGKTNDMLKELGEKGVKLAEDFGAIRQRVLDAEQKLADGLKLAAAMADEEKSIFEIIEASDEYKAAVKAGRMDPVNIKSFHRKVQIVNTTGQNQPLVPSDRTAGMIVPAEQRLYVRDLLPQARTTSNLIEYASEASFTNNARVQGDSSPGGIEGELKAESAMTFTLANAPVVTIAHWIPASRQVLSDAAMLQGHIGTRLIYGLKLQEEVQLLTGNGTAGTINGINNQAAAYNRGVTNDTILDTLLKALLQVSLSNYEPSAFVLHPIDWYGAIMLKDTTGRYLFSDPQSMVQPRIWAKTVVASQSQTQGRFTAGAFNLGAQIWDREDATVRISENVNDHFIRNMLAILAEERLAFTVYRTTAFVYGNTSHAG